MKTEDSYEHTAKDVVKCLTVLIMNSKNSSNRSKNENITRTMKGGLGGIIMRKFVDLSPKMDSYLKDDENEEKN